MLKLGRKILSFRKRIVAIVVGVTMVTLSLLFTNDMARRLREKEQHEVALWVHAMERVMSDSSNDPFVQDILSQRNNIPFIITNQNLKVLHSHLIPEEIINHPDRLRKKINQLTEENTPITIQYYWGKDHKHIIFFGQSRLLKTLYWFPYIQLSVIAIFILLGFIAFRSTKQDEQNRVWIGLAKETAHQLGTPTSSLLGWIEYLRTQPVDQGAVEEMNKDLSHLMKIVDRFSKIGSETPLTPENINEIVSGSVMYFRTRAPRNVVIDYNGLAIAPVKAQINTALFEWVVENLIKNSLDALQGHGRIDVEISSDDKHVMIDIKDTGKGIPKSNWKRIFEPGFTTKTRGWGLGLSLSRRVIEEYHQGRIGVVYSELGKGTDIRITLKRYFDSWPCNPKYARIRWQGNCPTACRQPKRPFGNPSSGCGIRWRRFPPTPCRRHPPSRPKSCSEPVRHSRSNRFRRNPSVPYTNRPLSKGSYWPWFSLIWSSSTITCGKFISSVGN